MSAPHTVIAGLRVLVVEDEPLVATILADQLVHTGCSVIGTADDGMAAIDIATKLRPDLILMDVHLKGDMDGIEAAERIHERLAVPVVYLTGDSDDPTLQRARAASAYGYVLKPFYFQSLLVAIEVAVHRFRTEQRLEENHLTYAAILGSISDAVITTDVGGLVRFMNAVAERLTGWRLEDAQGQAAATVLQIVNPAGEARREHLVSRVLASRIPVTLGHKELVVGRTSTRVPVDGSAAPVLDNLGRLVGTTVTLRDVTDVRKAQADLRAMAGRLRAVVDTAVDGVMLLDDTGAIVMFNPACARLFGYAAEEVIGRSVESLMPSLLTDEYGRHPRIDRSERRVPMFIKNRTTHGRCKNGATFPAELSVGEVAYEGKSVYVSVVHDVTERRELEAALLDAVGNEQRRFGRDLHDGLGQDLTGLAFLVEALVRRARREELPIIDDLERAAGVARHAIQECRSIAHGLSPVGEAPGGLIAGLRGLIGRLQGLPGPQIEFTTTNVEQLGLTPATTDHLFRIAQEALSNALKHSRANAINVTLDINATAVRLEVCDDGDGLRLPEPNTGGLGLRTMRYRAAIIGARFTITPKDGSGTCIVCECPQAA
jgi:PAS domain S-box-containing protein